MIAGLGPATANMRLGRRRAPPPDPWGPGVAETVSPPLPYEPGFEYGTILPFRKALGGSAELAAPSIVRDPVNAMWNFGRALAGQEYIDPRDAMALAMTALGANVPFAPRGAGTVGTVKLPGGAWTQKTKEGLATSLAPSREYREGLIWDRELPNTPEGQWADQAVWRYLNKYAGTDKDPLKDILIPFEGGTKRWEDVTDSVFAAKKRWLAETRDLGAGPSVEYKGQLQARGENPDEPMWEMSIKNRGLTGLPDDYPYEKALVAKQDPHEFVEAKHALEGYLAHVGDYLQQNVPPERLKQYDLVRAVRETAANDARVAKAMEKAQAADIATLPVHKAYDDGFRWVELKKPEKLTPEQARSVQKQNRWNPTEEYQYQAIDANGQPVQNNYTGQKATGSTPEEAWLAGQLAKEGNSMGHCVGGYCEDVASGKSTIFSLRDAKGGSHATVEVYTPKRWNSEAESTFNRFWDNFVAAQPKARQELLAAGANVGGRWSPGRLQRGAPEIWKDWEAFINSGANKRPHEIVQIKGKQNRAPNAEYLPYVQDFVRSGKWHSVGDLKNTGLVQTKDGRYVLPNEVQPGEGFYLGPME